MAKHRRVDSLVGVTATGAGSSEKTRGHTKHALLVIAENFDPGQDTLEVQGEVSADDTYFAPIDSAAPAVDNCLQIVTGDLTETDETGTFAAYIQHNDTPAEHIRANVTSYDSVSAGALTVTAYIFIGGWGGRGKSFKEREDTPTGQLGR